MAQTLFQKLFSKLNKSTGNRLTLQNAEKVAGKISNVGAKITSSALAPKISKPLADYVVPKIQSLAKPYVKNQVYTPIKEGVKTVVDPKQELKNRLLGGVQAVSGALSATPAGVGVNTAVG